MFSRWIRDDVYIRELKESSRKFEKGRFSIRGSEEPFKNRSKSIIVGLKLTIGAFLIFSFERLKFHASFSTTCIIIMYIISFFYLKIQYVFKKMQILLLNKSFS